jgi:hypothetical protein
MKVSMNIEMLHTYPKMLGRAAQFVSVLLSKIFLFYSPLFKNNSCSWRMEPVNQAASGGTIPLVLLAASETFPEPYPIKRYITFAERKKRRRVTENELFIKPVRTSMRAAYPHGFSGP